jgi:hypothetical protein
MILVFRHPQMWAPVKADSNFGRTLHVVMGYVKHSICCVDRAGQSTSNTSLAGSHSPPLPNSAVIVAGLASVGYATMSGSCRWSHRPAWPLGKMGGRPSVMMSKTELGFHLPADESMRRNAPPATPRYAGFGDGPPPRSGRSGRSRLAGAVPGNDVALSCATPSTGGPISPPTSSVYARHRRLTRRIKEVRRRPKQVFGA